MEDPIIPICSRYFLFASAALVAATPAAARQMPAAETLRSDYVQARTALAIGDDARSAELFAALAATDPAIPSLSRRAITAAISAGNTTLAARLAAAQPRPDIALDARLVLIADALRRGTAAQAVAMFDENSGDNDGAFLLPLLRGWAAVERRKDGSEVLARLTKDGLISPFAAEQQAYMLLALRRSEEAAPLIERALKEAGGRETRLRLAFAAGMRRAGDKARAATLLEGEDVALVRARASDSLLDRPGVAIDSGAKAYAELLTAMAVGLARGDSRSLPIALVQTARHAAPDSSEAAILLALLLDRDHRGGEALAVLRAIPQDDPFISDARDAEAEMLLSAKRGDEALRLSVAAASARGATAADHARLGNVLGETGRHAEAADSFGRAGALATGASNRWTYHLLRANELEEADRWPEARAELEQALKLAPDQPLLLNYLGFGALERGENLDHAEALIRKASALRPNDASIADSLGWALFKRGRTDEAIDTLRKASERDPRQAEIHEHLGDVLYSVGRRYEARFAWRAALVTAEDPATGRLQAKLVSGLTPASAAP